MFVGQFASLVNDSPTLTRLANSSLYPLIYVVQQFLHWFFMAYSLVPFCLLTYDKWLKVGHSETSANPAFTRQLMMHKDRECRHVRWDLVAAQLPA